MDYLRADDGGGELVQLLDVISTNVTSFFREAEHFEYLRDDFTRRLDAGQTRFRYWSAACSTGEEPWSMAMTLAEAAAGRPCDLRILATDISTRVLGEARAATYPAERLAAVPRALRERWFEPDGDRWRVKGALRSLVVFKRLNLSRPPYPMRGPLTMVFCRNVMIYFDRELRARLAGEFFRLLGPGDHLVIGHAESLTGIDSRLRALRPSVYARE